jgi:hypothetical protein
MATIFDERWLALGIVIIAVVQAVCFLPYARVIRTRAINAAGGLQLQVVRPGVRRWRIIESVIWAILGLGFVAFVIAGERPLIPGACLLMVSTITPLAALFGLDWLGLEIREKGLVVGSCQFWRWERISTYRWEEYSPATLALQLSSYGFRRFGVAPGQKATIDGMLHAHIRNASKSPSP